MLFLLWSSHRFSSQSNGCLTLWHVNNGWCTVNGKTTKKTKEYFCSHQCVTVSQDKARLLERCSLFKVCLYLCGCVCVCICVCWTTELLLSPLLSDCSLTFISFLGDEAPARQRHIEPVGETQQSCLSIAEAGRDDKTEQAWFSFFHFTDDKNHLTSPASGFPAHSSCSSIFPLWDFSLVSLFLRKSSN